MHLSFFFLPSFLLPSMEQLERVRIAGFFFFFIIAGDRVAFIELNMHDFTEQNTQTDGEGGKHILHGYKGRHYLK